MSSRDVAVQITKLIRSTSEALQVFLHTGDRREARDVAIELSKVMPGSPVPLVFLSGEEWRDHKWLWEPGVRNPAPRDRQTVLVVENFGAIPRGTQRSYAHLADGEDRENGLHGGSVLLLHVSEADSSGIEAGTLDRGLWIRTQEPSA